MMKEKTSVEKTVRDIRRHTILTVIENLETKPLQAVTFTPATI